MRIIITGAGSGIGVETARSFARAESKEGGRAGLFLVDRNPEGITALAQELGGIAQAHPFSASKAALLMLVRQMAVEWSDDGIRFLASPEAAYINGSDLIVNGGKQVTLMKA